MLFTIQQYNNTTMQERADARTRRCKNAQGLVTVRVSPSKPLGGQKAMKWITREHVKVDRVACPWLIKKFIDPEAEFIFVPAADVVTVAEREGATPFDTQ